MAKGKNILTTGDVARICNVAPRTVSKWFDSGRLKGYRIPGSKDRRIPIAELIRFMKQNNMPLPAFSLGAMRVVIADGNGDSASALADMLKANCDYEVSIGKTVFEIASLLHKLSPQVLLVNLLSTQIDADEICKNIRSDADLQAVRIIALANNHLSAGEATALLQKGFDGFISKSNDVSEVIKKIEEATSVISS